MSAAGASPIAVTPIAAARLLVYALGAMELASHDDGAANATCKHCGGVAAGPCLRCHAPLCGDCCVISEGSVEVYAICRDCAAEGAGELSSRWAPVLRLLLWPIAALLLLLVVLSLLTRR